MDAADALKKEISDRMRLFLRNAARCLAQLDDGKIWYRAHPEENAVGNLVLHLVGNLRQWILGGVGGQPDTRDRPAEFNASTGRSRDELAGMLHGTVEECCRVIDALPATRITEAKRIQDTDTTIAYALVMAVSHLGAHVGQIQFITKSLLREAYKESWTPPGK
jgi:hypothetical protein